MDVEIKIPKRLYDDIESYCNANNISHEKYCETALRKQLSLDKYGDLNEKFATKSKNVMEEKLVKDEMKEKGEAKQIIGVVKEGVKEEPLKDEKKEERKHRTIQTK